MAETDRLATDDRAGLAGSHKPRCNEWPDGPLVAAQQNNNKESALLRLALNKPLFPALLMCTLLAACGDNSDTSADSSASVTAPAVASPDAASTQSSTDNNGTATGLPPPPWAVSAPQPSSDGLLAPVVHTVD
jgi:hypothetical protein